jgi:eukaryotic-like serine/threonine-protein kinase
MHEPPPRGAISEDEFRRIREVFESALEQPLTERAVFVERACSGNSALLTEVHQMLAAETTPYPLLDRGVQLAAGGLRAGTIFATKFLIIDAIGHGGMGEVYRAHDSRLGRDVAIKILPRRFALDADRLARFKREAQVLGSLDHPNITGIHGVEESDDVQALVLELVEGPTLAERMARGPIPIDEAVPIARQIAEGLEAAHERGVVHRDLKPANVKLRPDGTVKLLDFGLAKLTQSETLRSPAVVATPTITSPSMVARGVLLGSAAYVSPEQARGREADKRSDIWAFGAVLYEMLSGRRAFQGDDVAETLASVLRQDLDWSALPASTPAAVRRLIARCLDRNAGQRLRDIGEARIVLEDPESLRVVARPVSLRSWSSRAMPIAATAIVAGVLGAAAAWSLRPSPVPAVTRLAFSLPDGAALFANRSVVAVSPDGTQVAYVTPAGLYLRSLSSFDAHIIRGSQDIFNITEPAFSPDGQSIVFHTTADQTLKRIPTGGGAAATIAHTAYPYGLRWGQGGILFVQPGNATVSDSNPRGNGIMRVSADGGVPETLITLKAGEVAYGPQLLPGEKQVLFTLATRTTPDRWDRATIVVQSLSSGHRKTLIEGGSDARYLPSGHLVYAVAGSLFAVAFDVDRLELRSAPVSVVEGIRRADASSTGGAHYSVSGNGTLVYVTGPPVPQRDIALTDRHGTRERLRLPPHLYETPRVSPDGMRIIVGTDDGNEAVIWTYRLSGATALERVTFGGNNRFPVWSADSLRVAFQSDREGDRAIFWQRVDGTGKAERLTTPGPDESHEPEAWSPAGDILLFSITKRADVALWTLSLKDRKVAAFGDVHSSTRIGGVFSPDGRWVAYAKSEAGKKTIYVEPFPPTGDKHQLVAYGSELPNHPLWSADGKELFYNPGPGAFASVSISTQPTLVFGKPTPLRRPFGGANTLTRRPYDIMADGRFVSATEGSLADGGPTTAEIRLVLNWFEELKARVPPTR